MERIIINGEPVEVPRDVEAKGREAIADWHKAQQAAAAKPTTTKAADAAKEK